MHLSDTFAALGNHTRLAIVERLLREGELPAGELVVEGEMSAPAMSHHFKVLRDAGIVVQRVDAQRRLYSVRPEAMRVIGNWTMTYREFWEQSLDRLGAAIDKEQGR
ncbi:ArsR/SmtB family transcription factor [Devosia nitrariae]|uniref:Transcriptional regulator n=1 Tax=Devosia nitrariae TaxID=2071872 RepID=A0ABQ5W1E6_9HYPH|nr:metalloregulator ArsR/SmtB family transcription factor [Devosia nitrariae]GLQ53722.1 transcriptional regulator [Devosia nitrariae]